MYPPDEFLLACESGDIVTVVLLIDKVNPTTYNNWPIELSCTHGHIDVVRLLLADPRVDPSANDNRAIEVASRNGYIDIVRLLLKDHRVETSMSDIFWAKRNGHTETVDHLTEHLYRLDGPEYNKNII